MAEINEHGHFGIQAITGASLNACERVRIPSPNANGNPSFLAKISRNARKKQCLCLDSGAKYRTLPRVAIKSGQGELVHSIDISEIKTRRNSSRISSKKNKLTIEQCYAWRHHWLFHIARTDELSAKERGNNSRLVLHLFNPDF